MDVKNDYDRKMGVPLLDISCALVSSIRLHSSVSSSDRHDVWAEASLRRTWNFVADAGRSQRRHHHGGILMIKRDKGFV